MVTSSLLMSVYNGVAAHQLSQCLASLKAQTRQPNQTVIVLDGPLSAPLNQLLQDYKNGQSHPVELVELETNQGLIAALNAGLKHCSGEWLIRMDADDISLPNRFETQLTTIESTSDLDVLGSAMLEFEDNPRRPLRLKPVQSNHSEIASSLPFRNPMNHPTTCIRKARLEAIGGYPQLPLLEDYLLWSQLLVDGARFQNIAEPLYLFRFDDGTLQRRGGKHNFSNEIWLRHWMFKQRLISYPRYCWFVLLQFVLRLAPLSVRRFLWQKSRRPYDKAVELPTSISSDISNNI